MLGVGYLLSMNQLDESTIVEVDGKSLRLTHLSKVMFPDDGFTKAELLLYYQTVAPLLLPHLRGRPLTLKAFPHGVKERPRQLPHKNRRLRRHGTSGSRLGLWPGHGWRNRGLFGRAAAERSWRRSWQSCRNQQRIDPVSYPIIQTV